MTESTDTDEMVTTARITRCRDGTPLGTGIFLSGSDLVQLGVDPVETDAVDVRIVDGTIELEPASGEPVIAERTPPAGVKDRWDT